MFCFGGESSESVKFPNIISVSNVKTVIEGIRKESERWEVSIVGKGMILYGLREVGVPETCTIKTTGPT